MLDNVYISLVQLNCHLRTTEAAAAAAAAASQTEDIKVKATTVYDVFGEQSNWNLKHHYYAIKSSLMIMVMGNTILRCI